MKILLVANYLPDAQQSMQRYALLLQKELSQAGHEARLLRPRVRAARMARRSGTTKWLGYIDKLVLFPKELIRQSEWADIVHICDHSNAVYVKYIKARPCVVTVHDLFAVKSALGKIPGVETRWSGRKLQLMILDGLLRARNVICVSKATYADFLHVVPCDTKAVTCIYNGLNYPFRPMARAEAEKRLLNLGIAQSEQFLLHVGGNQWYKNRLGVLKIFALLRKLPEATHMRLVMAGKPWTREMRQFASVELGDNSVTEIIDVSEEDLRALYSHATAFLFPSLEEGFGWPIVEAQACGCSVITSNRAPMSEVGGAAATYIDPSDIASSVEVIRSVLISRPSIREASLQNAKRFDPAVMVKSYLDFYKSLLETNVQSSGGDQLKSSLMSGDYQ